MTKILSSISISPNYYGLCSILIVMIVVLFGNMVWYNEIMTKTRTRNVVVDQHPVQSMRSSNNVTVIVRTGETSSYYYYDWDTIRYISGRFWYDKKYDELVYGSCNKQTGFEGPAETVYNKHCTGPIYHPLMCCFCYKSVEPTFINEEIVNNARNNNNIRNNNTIDHLQLLSHWEYHDSLLNITEYPNDDNSPITINSYINQYYMERSNYYFCMEPRSYSIPIDQLDVTYFRRKKNILRTDQQLVLTTGKFANKNKFKEDVIQSCTDISNKNLFDKVHCHYDDTMFMINDTRFERHRQYLYNESDETARGGGYWFHKVIVLRYYMDYYNDNDYILWSDHDYLTRIEPLGLYKMIQVMVERNADIIFELLGGIEQDWTKEDILHAFNATTAARETFQVWGGLQVVRNTPSIRHFYDALIECNANYRMISDEPSILPNHKGFEENRHDQSILSMFYKTFLSNQTVIGPPVQSYFDLNRYTFQLYDTTKSCQHYGYDNEGDYDGERINKHVTTTTTLATAILLMLLLLFAY